MKIFVAAVEALRIKERQDETQFITKFVGKTSLGSSQSFHSKIFILSSMFDALLCRNWPFSFGTQHFTDNSPGPLL